MIGLIYGNVRALASKCSSINHIPIGLPSRITHQISEMKLAIWVIRRNLFLLRKSYG